MDADSPRNASDFAHREIPTTVQLSTEGGNGDARAISSPLGGPIGGVHGVRDLRRGRVLFGSHMTTIDRV